MARERRPWDELYSRALRDAARTPAEVDSVPVPERWGTLPESEWEADAFLMPHLGASHAWLDLGCGTGSVLAAFLRRFPTAVGVGVDVSRVAISLGAEASSSNPDVEARLTLLVADLRRPPVVEHAPFDLVYALFSLQFLRPSELYELTSFIAREVLAPSGVFAGTVRSTGRSVPASYVAISDEPNSYVSHEPHEAGMVYHHYDREEIHQAALGLGGRVVHLEEKRAHRAYDPAPQRAWWDFVIARTPQSSS